MGGNWFDALWHGLDEDAEPAIAHYEDHYTPPKPGRYRGGGRERPSALPRLQDVKTWSDFVAGLRTLDDYCHRHHFGWDVLGETYSYLHTIGVGREIAWRGNWDSFSRRDRNVMCGLGHLDDTGAWGLLGNMGGAGKAIGAFTPPGNTAVRDRVLEQIRAVVGAEDSDIVETARLAVASIMELDRFGPGVATRFLALACPDRLVSVNAPSAAGLGTLSGIDKDKARLADNYDELLRALHGTEWFKAPEPDDAREREIWHYRTALVDAFIYVPIHETTRGRAMRRDPVGT